MKTRATILRGSHRVRGEAGFTMAEIAIALGVIAFALIAIIGILPAGLSVQKDNREETIITQDARLLLEAIKTGGRDITSDLGYFVVDVDGTNYDQSIPSPPPQLAPADLIRLLSDTNSHTFIFSAISGGIASRGSDLAFRYQVLNHVLNPMETPLFGGAAEFGGAKFWLTNAVHDVRLRFAWPVKADGKLGPEANRFVMRALVSGLHTNGVMYGQQYYNPLP